MGGGGTIKCNSNFIFFYFIYLMLYNVIGNIFMKALNNKCVIFKLEFMFLIGIKKPLLPRRKMI